MSDISKPDYIDLLLYAHNTVNFLDIWCKQCFCKRISKLLIFAPISLQRLLLSPSFSLLYQREFDGWEENYSKEYIPSTFLSSFCMCSYICVSQYTLTQTQSHPDIQIRSSKKQHLKKSNAVGIKHI